MADEQEVLELRAKVGQLVLGNFFTTRARTDSRAQRKEMVSKEEVLPVTKQCKLIDLPRSSYYYMPGPVSDEDLVLMKLIDQCYLE